MPPSETNPNHRVRISFDHEEIAFVIDDEVIVYFHEMSEALHELGFEIVSQDKSD